MLLKGENGGKGYEKRGTGCVLDPYIRDQKVDKSENEKRKTGGKRRGFRDIATTIQKHVQLEISEVIRV